ncbi:MAG: hypothetical protein KBA11_08330, partial [Sedimentibacter sp.]|nr:hypothetical protein [Sedimentibacter sp.]
AAAKIFSEGAGIDGFINTLFGQLARTGALSAEWVINETVDDIEDAVCVPVKSIRFLRKDGVYVPAQYISVMKDGKQYIELNPVSYSYYASDRVEDSPYAIPPMIAALSNIPIQKNIMEQLRFVARKSGLMGFLEVLVSAPMKKKNESEEQYKSRCREHIQAVAEKVKGSYNDGFMVAFKDLYEIKNTPVAGNAAGVYQLHQMNEEQIASGMGQDPAMLGRTYSTTETYAGVVMEKMLSQISNYQRLIKRFIEKGYKLKAALKGYNIDGLSIKFNSSDLEKKMEKAQALTVEIQNANLLYDAGIIDQNQRAQRLGFSSPALPGSRIEMTPPEIEQQAQIRQYRSKPAVILQTNRDGGYEIVEQIRRNF